MLFVFLPVVYKQQSLRFKQALCSSRRNESVLPDFKFFLQKIYYVHNSLYVLIL